MRALSPSSACSRMDNGDRLATRSRASHSGSLATPSPHGQTLADTPPFQPSNPSKTECLLPPKPTPRAKYIDLHATAGSRGRRVLGHPRLPHYRRASCPCSSAWARTAWSITPIPWAKTMTAGSKSVHWVTLSANTYPGTPGDLTCAITDQTGESARHQGGRVSRRRIRLRASCARHRVRGSDQRFKSSVAALVRGIASAVGTPDRLCRRQAPPAPTRDRSAFRSSHGVQG